MPRPHHLRIVLIGDSLTRYTYLSLVYFLRHGHWFDPDQRTPHLVQASSFTNPFHNQTWGEFSWQTHQMLYPYEVCDAYRKLPGRLQVNRVVNNRYFYDPRYDNAVVFLDAKGHQGSLHGRIPAPQVYPLLQQQLQRYQQPSTTPRPNDLFVSPPFDHLVRPFAWVYTSWSEAIREYVAQLDSSHLAPTAVVMNAGLWPNNFLYQPPLADSLVQALANLTTTRSPHNNNNVDDDEHKGCRGMWKTTTYGKGGTVLHESIPPTDQLMCAQLGQCWNTSWTRHVHDSWYWDDKHFFEPVYRILNEDLLAQLRVLPGDYQPMDRNVVLRSRQSPSF